MPRPPNRTLLVLAGLAVVATALFAASMFSVRPGEVLLVRGSGTGVAAVYPEGRHFRLRLPGRTLRLPHTPIAVTVDVEAPAKDQAVPVSVSGRFSVAPGQEAAWVAAAGWAPFVDGLRRVAEKALRPRTALEEGESVLALAGRGTLAAAVGEALAASGARAEGVTVRAAPEKNAALFQKVTTRVRGLARPSGRKILLVGWDGADWLMIRPLLAAGRMPHLARLMQRGAHGELASERPLLSPLIWTTMATGKAVTEHGVADFLVREDGGDDLVPIGSTARKVHALWTILPTFALRTDVVAWWATWPAEPTRGTVVTDRVAYQLFQMKDDLSGAGKVHPSAAWEWIRGELVPAEKVTLEEVRRFVDVSREEYDRLWSSLPAERRQEDRVNHLRKILATTRSYHSIALELLKEQADLTMVYYEGTDTVGHLFARYLPPVIPGVTAEEVKRFGHALPEFYAYADQMLGELVARAAPDTTVLLVSDHGFFTGTARPVLDPSDFTMGAPQWHRLHGIAVMAGPGVRPGPIDDATVFDVAPTVLATLGLPVPRDMRGRVLAASGTTGPVATVETYEALPREAAANVARTSEADQERLRELAALGYISAEAARSGAGAGPGAASGEMPTEAYNLGRIHQRAGDLDRAAEQYRIALQRAPEFGEAHGALAQILSLRGDHSGAMDRLAEGLARSRDMPPGAMTGLVEEARKSGRLDAAEGILLALPARYREMSAYHSATGMLAEARDRPADALKGYHHALQLNAFDEVALERSIALLRKIGREAVAREVMREAIALADRSIEAMNHLALICLRQRWSDDAERLFRRVLESDPGNPGVMANLAAALAQRGKAKEAAEMMRQALRREPGNAQNHFNLGAMLAEQGRHREALASFTAAREQGLVSPRLHVAAAKVHFRLGELELAKRQLAAALAVDPTDTEARELSQQLQ